MATQSIYTQLWLVIQFSHDTNAVHYLNSYGCCSWNSATHIPSTLSSTVSRENIKMEGTDLAFWQGGFEIRFRFWPVTTRNRALASLLRFSPLDAAKWSKIEEEKHGILFLHNNYPAAPASGVCMNSKFCGLWFVLGALARRIWPPCGNFGCECWLVLGIRKRPWGGPCDGWLYGGAPGNWAEKQNSDMKTNRISE